MCAPKITTVLKLREMVNGGHKAFNFKPMSNYEHMTICFIVSRIVLNLLLFYLIVFCRFIVIKIKYIQENGRLYKSIRINKAFLI